MNKTEVLQPKEDMNLVVAHEAGSLAAQEHAIDAGSIGSAVFHSAAAYLAINPKIPGYRK